MIRSLLPLLALLPAAGQDTPLDPRPAGTADWLTWERLYFKVG